MYNFGSFDAFIVKPTIMPDFARNLLHYNGSVDTVGAFYVTFIMKLFISFLFSLNSLYVLAQSHFSFQP